MEGALILRPGPTGSSSSHRCFAQLLGTTLYEFDRREDAYAARDVRAEHDIIGYARWDNAPHSFVFVTRLGKTWIAAAPGAAEHGNWLAGMALAVELVYPARAPADGARDAAAAAAPMARVPPPARVPSASCAKSGVAFGLTVAPHHCASCGRAFAVEHCSRFLPLVQHGVQDAARVCDDCYRSQCFLLHLKRREGFARLAREEEAQERDGRCALHSRWWSIRRADARGIATAAELLRAGEIEREDFDRAVAADRRFCEDRALRAVAECGAPLPEPLPRTEAKEGAFAGEGGEIPTFEEGADVGLFLRGLKRPPSVEECLRGLARHRSGGRAGAFAFRNLCDLLVLLGKRDLDSVDFFLPQAAHLFYLLLPPVSQDGFARCLALEEALLSLCALSATLALRLVWMLAGYAGDAREAAAGEADGRLMWILLLLLRVEPTVARRRLCVRDLGASAALRCCLPGEALVLTDAQAAVVGEHLERLEAQRELPPSRLALSTRGFAEERASEEGAPALTRYESVFLDDQLRWVGALTSMVDGLRQVPAGERRGRVEERLEAMMRQHRGYHATGSASEPICPITRVLAREGHVFKTKARVPTLLLYEIVRPQSGLRAEEERERQEALPPGSPGGSPNPSPPPGPGPEPEPEPKCPNPSPKPRVGAARRRFSMPGVAAAKAVEVERVRRLIQRSRQAAPLVASAAAGAPGAFREDAMAEASAAAGDGGGAGGEEGEAMAAAARMLAEEVITRQEFEEMVKRHRAFEREQEASSDIDVHFYVWQTFGESWAARKKRLQAQSRDGAAPGWDIRSIIVKSNDDLRQEVFALQLITLTQQILREAGLRGYVRNYRIVSTGRTTGIVETITDAMSLDALKKRNEGATLRDYFQTTYGASERSLRAAQRCYAESLAAYSLACYVFQIKDRHNGNILLDTQGHLIHIDFGFLLGIAPGGSFSVETAPFKLTLEMADVLGGPKAPAFADFVEVFVAGFLCLQAQLETIAAVVRAGAEGSPFPCFKNLTGDEAVQRLRQRMRPDLDAQASVDFALGLIRSSYGSALTKSYDNFQWATNGIAV